MSAPEQSLLYEENKLLKRALDGAVREILLLARSWRYKEESPVMYPELGRVFGECAAALENLGVVRARKQVAGDERLERQLRLWEVERETLPTMHPTAECIDRARAHLHDVIREQDGMEHPTTWQLIQACAWTLTALETLRSRLQ